MDCYWCTKEIKEGQRMIANEDIPMHYDCYLEEQEAWSPTNPTDEVTL